MYIKILEGIMQLNGRQVKNAEVDGVEGDDYPDFSDAFFSYAEFEDGTPLSDEELEQLGDENGEMINQLAQDKFNDEADYDYDQDR
jgi:hypothetical protein